MKTLSKGVKQPENGDTGDVFFPAINEDLEILNEALEEIEALQEASGIIPYVRNGYSDRFDEIIDVDGINEALDVIFDFGYAPPNISLGGSVSTALREKGNAISSLTLTAVIAKILDSITEVRFYRNPSTLLDTQTSGGAIPDGGSNQYTYLTAFSDTTTFRAEVDDDSAEAKPSRTATLTYTFVYPYYVGSGAAALSGSSIAALSKLIISQTNNHTYTIAVGSGQYTYYSFPASYGDLTSILDVNGFEVLPSWTKRTVSITGLDGNPVSYTVYEGNNPLTAGSYQFTFKR